MYTSTLLSRSPTSLLSFLSRLSKQHADHSLLFALSASPAFPAQDLSTLVNGLTTFSRHTIGCLSAPLPGRYRSLFSCSIAFFGSSESVLFRSTIPGRAAPQVGRWHAFRKKDDDDQGALRGLDTAFDNWSEVWDRSAGGSRLPVELQGLKSDFAVAMLLVLILYSSLPAQMMFMGLYTSRIVRQRVWQILWAYSRMQRRLVSHDICNPRTMKLTAADSLASLLPLHHSSLDGL